MTRRYNPYRNHAPLRCYPSADGFEAVSILEIGPGRGDFLFELARRHPEQRIAAIEIKKKRFFKLIRRIEQLSLRNIQLILGDARVALPRLFAPRQLQSIYLLFLDPWPKKRHAKHRLFQPYFVHDVYRSLSPSGEAILAHDNASYLNESRERLLNHPGFCRGEVTSPEIFRTFYAEKWQQAGRSLEACRVQKQSLSPLREWATAMRNDWFRYWNWRHRVSITGAASSAPTT